MALWNNVWACEISEVKVCTKPTELRTITRHFVSIIAEFKIKYSRRLTSFTRNRPFSLGRFVSVPFIYTRLFENLKARILKSIITWSGNKTPKQRRSINYYYHLIYFRHFL